MAQVPATSYESTSLGDVAEFTIPFPFLSRAEVFVTVDGAQAAFTWINDGLVQLAEVPELGAIVRRYRSTAAYVPLHQFSQGVPFLPRYVDRDFKQTLYAVQESVNDTAGTAALALATAEESLVLVQDAFNILGERTQYMDLGPYATGLEFQTTSQVFSYNPGTGAEFYAPGPSITLPYTTTGVGAAEIANFRSVGDAVLRQDLANGTSSLVDPGVVTMSSGGTLAQAVTYVTPAMFGAIGDGVADDHAAITAAATYTTANNVELWLSGSYAANGTLDFSAVRKIRCFNDARIVPLMDVGVAVKWVAGSGLLIEKPVQVGDLHVDWPTRDWTKDRTSFLIQNIYNGKFSFSSSKATRGLLMKGLEKGAVYNDVNIGVWANNLVGVWLSSGSATGWCNANRIIGGRYYGATGVGAGQEIAGSLYETRAGHIYIETTPYQCNGNVFVKPSIEWIGAGFRLARMGGLSNRLEPVYGELGSGDTTWVVDTGTNNLLDLTSVPSLSNGYDPDLSGAANRVDVSGAVNPKVYGTNGLLSGVVCQTVRTSSPTRAAIRAANSGVGPAIEARSQNSASNPGLAVTGPSGSAGVLIPPAGFWTVFNGSKKMSWSNALAPTTGDWTRGDVVFFTNPSAGGFMGAVCTASGTPGTWKNWGAISA